MVAGFLRRTLRWSVRRSVWVERVLTDNDGAYGSHVFRGLALAQRCDSCVRGPSARGSASTMPSGYTRVWNIVLQLLASRESLSE